MIEQLIKHDQRWSTFLHAVDYVNYESVPGDIMEFGVFAGCSLALLAKAYSFDNKGMTRRIIGFDSFEGLPISEEKHPRWRPGDCRTNHAWHPLLEINGPVMPQVTIDLFKACQLPAPLIEVGPFHATLPCLVPAKYPAVALLHVDCDLYESTRDVLQGIAPALQDGSLVLFDDWFHYKGNPNRGEAAAFREFLQVHPEWEAVHYRSFGTFCNSFILHRK
ncbi:MAG: TylF/MycF/NovP-related O-methyltransferase [Candidatus Binatia bacterium]